MSKKVVCLITALATIMMTSLPLYAEVRLQMYRNAVAKGGQELAVVNQYIEDIAGAFVLANAALSNRNKPLLYCQTERLDIPAYRRILDKEIKENNYPPSTEISMLLLWGLENAFPCPAK